MIYLLRTLMDEVYRETGIRVGKITLGPAAYESAARHINTVASYPFESDYTDGLRVAGVPVVMDASLSAMAICLG